MDLLPYTFQPIVWPELLPLYIKAGTFEIRLFKPGERVKRKALIEEILNRERYGTKLHKNNAR